MRNFKMLFFLFGLMVITTPIFSSPKVEEARVCIRQYYDSQTYVKELTNRNDGVEITGYFHKIGIFSLDNANSAHRAWCGAFQANAWLNCNVPVPFTRYLSRLASVDTWNKATAYQIPFRKADTGDVVSFKFRHVEGVYERHPNPSFPYFESCGGNTSAPKGKGNKEGVWIKTRLIRDVSKVVSLEKVLNS